MLPNAYIRRCRALQRVKELRNTGMLRLRKLNRLCSSNVSDTANRLRNGRNGNPTAVPHFRSGRRSPIFAGLTNKGKVGVQRGRKTAGCPSSLPPPRGAARSRRSGGESPAEVQRKTSRPERANPPAAVRAPRSAGAEKEPHRQAEPACGSSCAPVRRCRKRCRTVRAEPADAVRVPRSAGAGKRRVQPAIKIFKKICVTLLQNTRK